MGLAAIAPSTPSSVLLNKSIFVSKYDRSLEFISDRLLKVALELCGRTRAVTFVVGYL